MKFLLAVFGMCLIGASLFAQVQIPKEVAIYYLHRDEKCTLLEEKDSLNQILISNFREQSLIQQQIITTYKNDSISYNSIIATKEEEITLLRKDKKRLKRILTGTKIGLVLILILVII